MTALPPPELPQSPADQAAPAARNNRRRTALIALVASALAIGGVAAGAQLVSAVSTSPGDDTEEGETEGETNGEIDDTVEDASGDGGFTTFLGCISGEFDFGDGESFDFEAPFDFDFEDLEGTFESIGENCTPLLPDELQTQIEAFDEYGTCIEAELGVDGEEFFTRSGSVTVDVPSDGESGTGELDGGLDFSVFDFGDGDGSVTITKTDGQITVETGGDVTELDESMFGEIDEKFGAAHDACADQLPDGADFGGLTEFMGPLGAPFGEPGDGPFGGSIDDMFDMFEGLGHD